MPDDPRPPTTDDAGFSLVELMVVLLVLGILLAIAIPTFLGTTATADNRSAQSNLNTALTQSKGLFDAANQTYFVGGVQDSPGFVSLLTNAQLGVTFHAGSAGTATSQGSSGSMSVVSVGVSSDGNGIVLAAYSLPGLCFYIVDNAGSLSGSASGVAPYTGTQVVTQVQKPVSPASGVTLGLPSTSGTSYVEVKGDTTATDCNAYTPKASGSSATVQYLTGGFPN